MYVQTIKNTTHPPLMVYCQSGRSIQMDFFIAYTSHPFHLNGGLKYVRVFKACQSLAK